MNDLGAVIDMESFAARALEFGVDPLGGAGIALLGPYRRTLRPAVDHREPTVDPTFRFMRLDWDGKIRMDCSSPYAMASLIAMKDRLRRRFRQ